MKKYLKVICIILILNCLLCSCKKQTDIQSYPKENAGGTGYGAAAKSGLYIEDFYFLTIGCEKSKVETLNGSAHYLYDNDTTQPTYTLENGDNITIVYEQKQNRVIDAKYTYHETQKTDNFFDILVELGVLKSSNQQSQGEITVVPDIEDNNTPEQNDEPSNDTQQTPSQNVVQGKHFATGLYNLEIIKPALKDNMKRTSVITTIGKPSYYSSHSFSNDSYIIDCYNLTDGSKLYLDYGYDRLRLRCAAVYKGGKYTNILSTSWSMQKKPDGYTRVTVSRNKLNVLSKNMTPANAYAMLGEPSWYEGNQGHYNDIFALTDGAYALLGFGSAHNKLTSISIKETDGSITVLDLH